jgi:phosphate transport system permease protein
MLGGFFGVAIAIFLTQDFLPPKLELVFKNIIELLAAIPSVVYGLWGLFVLIPTIRPVAQWFYEYLGWIPFFGTSLSGPGLLPASIVLTIMILPTVSAISRDALSAVPPRLREAAFGMGATHWEVILRVILPTAATGIFGALVLGFGRALGETMALAMLVGNSNQLSISLFSPANTLAALLALNFPEATKVQEGVLMYAAVVLMAITLLVNICGAAVLRRATINVAGGR